MQCLQLSQVNPRLLKRHWNYIQKGPSKKQVTMLTPSRDILSLYFNVFIVNLTKPSIHMNKILLQDFNYFMDTRHYRFNLKIFLYDKHCIDLHSL